MDTVPQSPDRVIPALLEHSARVRRDLAERLESLTMALSSSRRLLAEMGFAAEPHRDLRPVPQVTVGLLDSLTRREVEVLRLIAEGKSTKEIGGILNISFKTAVCHRSRILQKLGMHETASMVRLAIRAGLIEP